MFILKHVDIKEVTIMMMRPFIVIVLLTLAAVTQASAAHTCLSEAEIPSTTPTSRFIDNGNGTVTDKTTGLMWARCAEGLSGTGCTTGSAASFTWDGALVRARDSGLAGYTDWRLPDVKELSSLLEGRCWYPAINLAVFPNTPDSYFWSVSPSSYASSYAWYVSFVDGDAKDSSRSTNYRVRLVRSGQ